MSNKIKKFWAVEVDDYHQLAEFSYAYTKAGISTTFKEVGCDGPYHAIFWIGKKTKEVNDAIIKLERDLTW
jgi:hypothetical protein